MVVVDILSGGLEVGGRVDDGRKGGLDELAKEGELSRSVAMGRKKGTEIH